MSVLDTGDQCADRVVVLPHGWGSGAATWEPLIEPLARHARVLAPDLLGHGESAALRAADYSVGGHACRLRDLPRNEGTPSC